MTGHKRHQVFEGQSNARTRTGIMKSIFGKSDGAHNERRKGKVKERSHESLEKTSGKDVAANHYPAIETESKVSGERNFDM